MYATGLSCWKCRITALVNSSEKEENVPFCRFLVHCMTFSYSNRQLLHRLNNECKGLNRKSRLTSRHNGNKPRSPFGANQLSPFGSPEQFQLSSMMQEVEVLPSLKPLIPLSWVCLLIIFDETFGSNIYDSINDSLRIDKN